MPLGKQVAPQITIVIDLPVEDNQLGPIFVEDRLMSPSQIDDAEASHAHPHASLDEQPLIVRSPMTNRIAHGANSLA